MKKTSCSNRSTVLLGAMACLLVVTQVTWAEFVFGEPEMVPSINSQFSDGSPQISRDGLELYMVSRRDSAVNKICVSKRATTQDSWPEPTPLDAPVNPAVPQDFPSLSADGLELYFADGELSTPDPAGYGSSDIWVLTRETIYDPWNAPQNLGPTINGPNAENTPCIAADGLELYFASNVPDHPTNSDILVATRASRDDPWGKPVTLNTNVNTLWYEYNPFISANGLALFFSRGLSTEDMYVSRRASITDPWGPASYFSPVNIGGTNHCVSFSDEDSAIYFTSGTNIFATDFNIWRIKVTPIIDFNTDGRTDIDDMVMLMSHWGQDNPSFDIWPIPFGDGRVDDNDLKVLKDRSVDPTLIAHHSGALQFDGLSDHVRIPTIVNAQNDVSIFGRIKGGGPGQVILSQVNGLSWLCQDPSTGCLMTDFGDPTYSMLSQPLSSEMTITDGSWHHVGLVWSNHMRSLYVDGLLVAQDAKMVAVVTTLYEPLYLGTAGDLVPESLFEGLIDDVRIYNRALDPDEIAELAK